MSDGAFVLTRRTPEEKARYLLGRVDDMPPTRAVLALTLAMDELLRDLAAADQRGYERAIEVLRDADRRARWNAVQPDGRVDWDRYDHAFDACADYLAESVASPLVKGDSDGR